MTVPTLKATHILRCVADSTGVPRVLPPFGTGTIALHLTFLVEHVRLCSGPGLRALNL